MTRYLVAGHISYDLFPRFATWPTLAPGRLVEAGPLAHAPGGCVSNTATTLAGLGHDVAIAACVGGDFLGELLREALAARGLPVSGLREAAGSTSYTVVTEAPGVDRAFWHHLGANAAFDGSGLDFTGVDLLHTGYPPLLPALLPDDGGPLADLLERAREEGVTTSLDLVVVDPRGSAGGVTWSAWMGRVLPRVDVLTPSLDDLRSLTRETGPTTPEAALAAADALVAAGVRCVAVTAGTAGFAVATAERPGSLPPLLDRLPGSFWGMRRWYGCEPVPDPARTTGAGDAFSAGFVSALATAGSVDEAADAARRAARRHVTTTYDPVPEVRAG